MHGLDGSFQDLTEVAGGGLGPVLSGRRAGRPWTIRVLTGVSRTSVPDAVIARLGRPCHPAVLPVEIGASAGGAYLAAEVQGVPVAALDKPALPAARCVEIGIALAEAADAASREVAGAQLGPITWSNVYVDPARPGIAFVLPLWAAGARSADWLRHAPADLLFLDRDMLRQAPTPRSDVFSIGAILLVLSGGANHVRTGEMAAADVIRRAVMDGHPLSNARVPDGALGDVIRRALAPAGARDAIADARALHDALVKAKPEEPVPKALALHAAGRPLEAMKVLHRAVQEGERTLPVLLLKARIEAAEKLIERARRTLLDAHAIAPSSRDVLVMLTDAASDPAQALDAATQAAALDPTDARLALRRAIALDAAGKADEAMDALAVVGAMSRADPSCGRASAEASMRLGRILLDRGLFPQAIQTVEPYRSADQDADIRLDALALSGCALYRMGVFDAGEKMLREAAALERKERSSAPRTWILNDFAHALVATGKLVEAEEVVRLSLSVDSAQEKLWVLLAAIRGRIGGRG